MKKLFEYKNATATYKIIGNGKPVVLIHGFAEDSTIFNAQIEFLKNYCLLIVPDLPGSGASATNIQLLSIEDFAHFINALLQQENITECTMLGHSMGGYITLAFAELFPDKLNGFGLIHSSAFADSEEKKLARQKGITMIEEYGSYPFLKNTIPSLFGKKFKEENVEEINELIEAGKSFTAAALQQYYTAMMNRVDRTQVLKNSKNPILFIIGTEDAAIPLNDVLQQTILPNCSYIHLLDGVGHMSMLEATEKLNLHLLHFINR